jgi:hypothetical protein
MRELVIRKHVWGEDWDVVHRAMVFSEDEARVHIAAVLEHFGDGPIPFGSGLPEVEGYWFAMVDPVPTPA